MDLKTFCLTTVKYEKFPLSKSAPIYNKLLIGLDHGCSLIKAVFLDKIDYEAFIRNDEDFILMTAAIFSNNENIENILNWIKSNAYLKPLLNNNDDNNNSDECFIFRYTGALAYKNRHVFENIFGIKSKAMPEDIACPVGYSLALKYIEINKLIWPDLPTVLKMNQVDKEGLVNIMDIFTNKATINEPENQIFPCIVFQGGSAAGFIYYDNNGVARQLASLLQSGKSLLGLTKALIDTNNYDEIMELAEKGDRGNVDTKVKDVINEDPDSPYGKWPQDICIFSFGKCDDDNFEIENINKEDIASSIISLKVSEILLSFPIVCKIFKTNKIYMDGNLFRHHLFRKLFANAMTLLPASFQLKFFNCGYAGALAAMLLSNEDGSRYMYPS